VKQANHSLRLSSTTAGTSPAAFQFRDAFSQFDNIGQFAQHGGPKFPGKQGYIQAKFPFPLGVTSFLVAESER